MTYTAKQKLDECLDELGWRRAVYPRRVLDGVMTQAEADRKISLQLAITADYRRLAAAEHAGTTLFAARDVANDRGPEQIGQVAERVLSATLAELEQEANLLRDAAVNTEAALARVRRLGVEIHNPPSKVAAE